MPELADLRPLTAGLPPIVILSSLDFGGAGIAALRLHQGLVAAGADCKMIVLKKQSNDPTVGELSNNGVPLWDYACAGWQNALRDYPNRPAGLEMFSTADAPINVADLDIVKNAGLVNLHWCAGMLKWPEAGNGLRGKPVVWTLHDMNPFTGGCHYAGNCNKWQNGGCEKCPQLGESPSGNDLAAFNFTAKKNGYTDLKLHIVSPSGWLGETAGKSLLFGNHAHSVIPNGFPLEKIHPQDRAAARRKLNLPENRPVIMFGADCSGNRRKGLHLLTEALHHFAKIWKKEPPVLAIFGIPSAIPQLPEGCECCVLGKLSGEEQLSAAYSAADVFVLPSTEDNLPNTLIEAQACGTPCVGFAIGGIPDIIENSKLGRLAKPFDTADLAEKIKEVLEFDANAASSTRRDCREHAESTYTQYAQTEAYLRLYRKLLGLGEKQPAMSNSANNIEEKFAYAQSVMEAKEFDKALTVFSEIKSLKIPHINLDLFRGWCFLQLQQVLDAKQALLEELRYFPNNENAKQLLLQIDQIYQQQTANELQALQVNDEFRDIYNHIKNYTMVCLPRLWSIYNLVRNVCIDDIPGNFVECGVAAGGTSALIATVLHRYSKRERKLYSFDTFSGMPEPTTEDYNVYSRKDAEASNWGTGTCAAPEESLKRIASELGVFDDIVITKGLFADTLPQRKGEIGKIAFLHMDGDWYQSTKDVIDNVYDIIHPGAAVQVDDFGGWAGCKKALTDYFSQIQYTPEITKIDATGISFKVSREFAAKNGYTEKVSGNPPSVTVDNDSFAPIVLFTYNRKDLAEKTVNALKANAEAKQTDLYVFSDGPKPGHENDPKIKEVRDYLRTVDGFKSVKLIMRENNLGLGNSIIAGVTEIVNQHGKVIVMEDDLVTSPYFLKYMNDGLRMYADDPEVTCISGYAYPIKQQMPDSYFIRGICCLGWGTWKDSWKYFNPNGQELLDEIVKRNAVRDFDFGDCYPYTNMLNDQIHGRNTSWAVRWMASAFLNNLLCLYPGHSFVNHIGFGAGATNCTVSEADPLWTEVTKEPLTLRRIPVTECPENRVIVGEFLRWSYIVLVFAANYAKLPSLQLLEIVKRYIGNNQPHYAKYILEKIAERGENLEGVNAMLGWALWETGEREAAVAAINKEISEYPKNSVALDLLQQISSFSQNQERTV